MRGATSSAIERLEREVVRRPDDAALRLKLGDLYAKAGREAPCAAFELSSAVTLRGRAIAPFVDRLDHDVLAAARAFAAQLGDG